MKSTRRILTPRLKKERAEKAKAKRVELEQVFAVGTFFKQFQKETIGFDNKRRVYDVSEYPTPVGPESVKFLSRPQRLRLIYDAGFNPMKANRYSDTGLLRLAEKAAAKIEADLF